MANITEEHLHHMAKRHHATMKKFDGMRERIFGITERFVGTVETAAGAWLGGTLEGRTEGGTILRVPYNLGIGVVLLAAGHIAAGHSKFEWQSGHLNNLGNGFIGSYLAAVGFSFGKRWKETGKLWGGHTWGHPYGEVAPPTSGDLSEAQMAAIVQRMQAAAAAPHP